MRQVIVRNSCIVVTEYNKGDCPTLEKNFMVYEPLYHKYNILGMHFDKEHQLLFLPRGIDIWYVKKQLGIKDHIVDDPNPYLKFDVGIKYKPRDREQIEALQFMCGVGEQYEENLYAPQLSVNLNTGKGKTYCSIATICYFGIKAVVIAASTSLLNQWKLNILEYTNLEDKDVFIMSGSPTLNMAYHNKSKVMKEAKIFLVSHATIRSYADSVGWDKLNTVFKNIGVGIKIIDEAHTNFENMLMLDFYTNIHKTYYVTATPKRSDWREDRIYQLSLKNIPGIDLFDAMNDPHTEYIAIKYNSRPSPYQISACKNAYGLDRNKYINYVTKQPNFYKMMYLVMDLVQKCGGRVLMYIGTNEALLRVYEWIGTNYPEYLGDIGIFTSLVDKEKKLAEREKKIILSTTKSAGLGEHIEGLKMTVVVAEPFKSEVLARQSLGRTRDPDTKYVELVDMGFRYIQKFYYAKLSVFNKYASDVSDVTIDQYELDKRSDRIKAERDEYISKCPIKLHDTRFFEYPEEPKIDIEAIRKKLYEQV